MNLMLIQHKLIVQVRKNQSPEQRKAEPDCFTLLFALVLSVRGKSDKQRFVVVLLVGQRILCAHFKSRLVSALETAFIAFIQYHKSLFGIGERSHRSKYAAAIARPVTGKYIHMKRTQAFWAVISACATQGFDLKSTVYADKTLVVF